MCTVSQASGNGDAAGPGRSPGPFSAWEPRGLRGLGAPGAGSAFPRSGGPGGRADPEAPLRSSRPAAPPPRVPAPGRGSAAAAAGGGAGGGE